VTAALTSFTVRLPVWWRPFSVLLHLSVALLVAAWVATLLANEAWAALAWVPPAGAAWWLSIRWRPPATGRLRSDGQCWFLGDPARDSEQECEGSLTLAVDGGRWLLLRFKQRAVPGSRAGTVWLLLGQGDSPHDGATLRRAVYSPRPDPAGPSAQATAHPPA
jgi:hypothetical protein